MQHIWSIGKNRNLYIFNANTPNTLHITQQICIMTTRILGCLIKKCFQVEDVLDDWRDYKLSVPTYGAIILNEDLSKVQSNPDVGHIHKKAE